MVVFNERKAQFRQEDYHLGVTDGCGMVLEEPAKGMGECGLMKRIQQFANKVCAALAALPYAWQSAPGWLVGLTAVLMLQGIAGPIIAWLAGQTVGVIGSTFAAVSGSVNAVSVGAMMNKVLLLGAWIIVLLFDAGLYPLVYLFSSQLNERMTLHIQRLILDKGLSFKRIDNLADEDFHDRLSLILNESKSRPVNYIVLYTYILRGLVSIVSYFVLLIPYAWWLPFVVIASGVPLTFSLERMRERNWVAQRAHQSDLRQLEYLAALPFDRTHAGEIRLFGMADMLRERFDSHVNSYTSTLQSMRMKSLLGVLPGLLVGLTGYGLSIAGMLYLPTVASVTGYAVMIQSFVSMRSTVDGMVQNLTFLGEKAYFFRDFRQFMDTEETWPSEIGGSDGANVDADAAVPPDIELRDVWFRYPHAADWALRGVNLHIRPGETAVICGANGAGKSTLIGLVSGLYIPTRGQVLVDGRPLDVDTVDAVRSRMAALLQPYSIYGFDVASNVDLSMRHDKSERLERALRFGFGDGPHPSLGAQLLEEFGGVNLSGGQQQRLALARLAYRDAPCLLLDEPTSAIDPIREAELFDAIRAFCKGRTALLVTHRLSLTAAGDQIIVMDGGRIAESGSLSQLRDKSDGLFARMLAEQARITVE